MRIKDKLIQLLHSILKSANSERVKVIKEFQNEVWNDNSIQDQNLNELLSEIAYDLDFYEPNEKWRKEALSFYSNKELEELIKNAIQKLQGIADEDYDSKVEYK